MSETYRKKQWKKLERVGKGVVVRRRYSLERDQRAAVAAYWGDRPQWGIYGQPWRKP